MAVGFAVIFGGGIVLRVLTHNNYQALDLGLEGALLAGVLSSVTGLTGGILISLPACVLNGEWMAMSPLRRARRHRRPAARTLAPHQRRHLALLPLSRPHRLPPLPRQIRHPCHALSQLCPADSDLCRVLPLGARPDPPRRPLSFTPFTPPGSSPTGSGFFLIYSTTIFAFAIPLEFWNSIRQERLLGAQQRLLTEARLRALTSQINPHFLFNTLNTVNSLIRTNPEEARAVVRKLSNILRRLLRKDENLSPLRDEISFINDYLSIEMTRFGEKLRFVNETDAATLDRLVPSMLLQPIIENSIKHGLSSKVEGGVITLRTHLRAERLHIEIEDDGVGVGEDPSWQPCSIPESEFPMSTSGCMSFSAMITEWTLIADPAKERELISSFLT